MMAYLQGKSQLIGGCKRGSREGPENLNGCDVLIDCRTTIRVLTGRASQTTVDASSRGFCIPSNGGQTHLFPQRQQNELLTSSSFLFFFKLNIKLSLSSHSPHLSYLKTIMLVTIISKIDFQCM